MHKIHSYQNSRVVLFNPIIQIFSNNHQIQLHTFDDAYSWTLE